MGRARKLRNKGGGGGGGSGSVGGEEKCWWVFLREGKKFVKCPSFIPLPNSGWRTL